MFQIRVFFMETILRKIVVNFLYLWRLVFSSIFFESKLMASLELATNGRLGLACSSRRSCILGSLVDTQFKDSFEISLHVLSSFSFGHEA